jgi:hypothetical protein
VNFDSFRKRSSKNSKFKEDSSSDSPAIPEIRSPPYFKHKKPSKKQKKDIVFKKKDSVMVESISPADSLAHALKNKN